MKRYPAVNIGAVDNNVGIEAPFQYMLLAVDCSLVQAISLVDVIVGVKVHEASVEKNLKRLYRGVMDGGQECASDAFHERVIPFARIACESHLGQQVSERADIPCDDRVEE
jgi:hypothetical protein